MVHDRQVRRLFMLKQKEESLGAAAAKAGIDEKTARKYLRLGRLPSQVKAPHDWRTRPDPFADVWEEVRGFLELDAGLEAKTIFEELQRMYPGRFSDGQLRTLQRRVKRSRALEGPSRETFFPQVHEPGDLAEMDFTWMNELGITIQRQRFDHLLFHFVLTYSNWEAGTVCFSESFESLSLGLQNALWELGGVPKRVRTDRLSSAVHQECREDEFTARYRALLRHYGTEGVKIQAAEAHENGDVEQRHYRVKRLVDQALRLRGSRDFETRAEYECFLRTLFNRANRGRRARFEEELRVLRRLPERRLDDFRPYRLRVSPSSTIRVMRNTYSVQSRLIGEVVTVRLYGEHLDVSYGQKLVERIPRLRGEHRHRICYRHIIDWLVRKPGAFEHYRYREDLFPTTRFRMAWDVLAKEKPTRAVREYLEILYLAAKESETGVDDALQRIFDGGEDVSAEAVKVLLCSAAPLPLPTEVEVAEIPLGSYDELLGGWAEETDGRPE
jgi:hypothetical protein